MHIVFRSLVVLGFGLTLWWLHTSPSETASFYQGVICGITGLLIAQQLRRPPAEELDELEDVRPLASKMNRWKQLRRIMERPRT